MQAPLNGIVSLRDKLSGYLVPIMGSVVVLLLGALWLMVKGRVDDHSRWLVYLQREQDMLKYELARREPAFLTIDKTADLVYDSRLHIVEIREQLIALNLQIQRLDRWTPHQNPLSQEEKP